MFLLIYSDRSLSPYALWYIRLGHISLEIMIRLMKEGILSNLPESSGSCTECIEGKSTKMKRNGSIANSNILEIIHNDICGPFPTVTHNGKRYVISFFDDFSRYAYVFLIAKKSNTIDVFKIYKTKVQHQLEKTIEIVKSNCGLRAPHQPFFV